MRDSRRFWEFVVMLRKAVFVGVGLLRDERAVWAVYLALTTLALGMQVKCEPYRQPGANLAERHFLAVQVATLALGGAFTFGLDTTSLLAKLISVVLIAINLYTLWPMLVRGLHHHHTCPCAAAVRHHRGTSATD